MPANAFDDALTRLPKSANPFDDIADDMVAQRTTAVKTAVERGARENPDQQAELIRTADRLRVPLDVVKRNPDDYKGAGALHQPDLDRVFRDSPRLAQYLTVSPEFASVAHDDLPQLSAMETSLSWRSKLLGAVKAGYYGMSAGVTGAVQGAAEFALRSGQVQYEAEYGAPAGETPLPMSDNIADQPHLIVTAHLIRQHLQEKAAQVRGVRGTGFVEQGVLSGVESLTQAAVLLPLSVLTGSTVPMLAGIGASTFGTSYGQTRDVGGGVALSAARGGFDATVEIATEYLPAKWVLGDLATNAPLRKILFHQLAGEIPGEEIATALQDLSEWAVMHPEAPIMEYVKARPGAFSETLVAAVVSVGVQSGGVHLAAAAGQKMLTGLGQAATSSKTAKRSPEAVESFVAQAVKDSPTTAVYAPVDTWTTYWQSKGEDPAAMATSLTGDPQAYQRSLAQGTDLEIPIAKYAAKLAGTEHNAFFANELKLDPAEMNGREAAAHVEQLRQQQQAAQPEAAAPSTLDQATDLMTQRMVEQGIPQDTAQTYGAIWRAGIGTLASNFGIDPLELQAQYGPQGGPTITREGMEPAPTQAPVPGEAPPDEAPEGVPVEVPTAEPKAPDTILSPGTPATTLAQGPLAPAFLQAREALREQLHAQMLRREEATKPPPTPAARRVEMERQAIEKGHPFVVFDQEGHRRVIPPEQWDFKPAPGETYGIETPQGFQVLEDQGGMLPDTVLYQSAPIDDATGLPLNPDGTVTLYHHTTSAAAQSIIQSGELRAAAEPDVYLTTEAEPTTGYGEAVVAVDVDPSLLTLDDEFPNGRKDFRLSVDTPGGTTKVIARPTRFQQEQRGEIRFGADRQFNIHLLEQADLSTALHEFGHFFLEVFGDLTDQLAQREGATLTPEQQRLQTDHAALLQWLGVDSRAQIGREQHEQFARGFEAYLMEGKAPSLELRSAFARARAWLLGIYKQLRNLNVTLTPDVRGIFDRLLASDAAIQQAQQTASVSGMFLNAESAGMSEAQFASYRGDIEDASRKAKEELDRQILAEVQREQTATWKAQREQIKEQVTTEVQAQPVYRALAAMQKGTHPNGEALFEGEETPPLKLSKTIISERYGPERLKSLPKPYIYSREGGLDPDTVAEMFGFSSGDALLTAVSTAPSMRSVIERETAGRMFQQHGSLLLDGTLGEKAQAAVANDSREEVIRKELKALHTLQRKGAATLKASVPSMTVIRNAAADQIARTKYGDIKPQLYWAAGLRTGRQAVELAAQQKFPEAVAAKQQQLFNLALYREAVKQRANVDGRVAFAKELDSPKSRARIGLAGGTFQDQIDGILDQYDFARVSQKALDRRASLRKWVAALEGEGLPVDLPEDLLEQTRRIHYRDLTVEQLIGVTDGLQQIVHLARLKNKLLKSAAKRDLDETAGGLGASIRDNATTTRKPGPRDRRQSEERRRTVSDFFAGHRKLASLLREMDGFEDGGPAWEAIMRPLNEAGDREAEMNAEATAKFSELIEAAYPGKEKRTLYTKRAIPAITNLSLSKMERLMVAFNWGNEGNRDRVRSAEGWTDQQVRAILDTLDRRDLDFVQGIFDFFESYRSDIGAKQTRVYGVEPTWVEATPIQAAAGEIRGGYFPLKYDDRLSASAIAKLDLEAANLAKQAAYSQATTKRGHTKERVEHLDIPVRLDFGVMFEHVKQVIHDLSHHEALIDVGRILGHREVQQAILETHGDLVYKQIRGTIRDIAFGDIPAVNGFERALNHVRAGATVAGLGWNLTTAFLQPLGLTNSAVRVGPLWLGKGIFRWIRSPSTMVETVEWVTEKSAFMRNRARTQQREINEIRNAVGVNTGVFSGWIDSAISSTTFNTVTRQGIADSYFWLIQQMQRVADVPTWLGQYEKSMAAGEPEDRAVAIADQAVLDSQGGGQIKDLAQVQRGGPMMKLWTNFYSFFNVLHNQSVESKRKHTFASPGSVGRMAVDYLMLFTVPATLGYLVRSVMRPGDDDDDSLAWRLVMENASYLSGTLLGLREISGTLQGYYGYEGPAGARAFGALARLGKQVQQGETDAAFWRALNDMGGILFHYPSGQARKTVEGIAALSEGRTQNPGAILAGPPPKGQ